MRRTLTVLALLALAACAEPPTKPVDTGCWLDYGTPPVHVWVHYPVCPDPLPPDAVRGNGP